MERSTMLSMGKSTISMAMFNSKLLNYQRVLLFVIIPPSPYFYGSTFLLKIAGIEGLLGLNIQLERTEYFEASAVDTTPKEPKCHTLSYNVYVGPPRCFWLPSECPKSWGITLKP
jgi:hypothetical protein